MQHQRKSINATIAVLQQGIRLLERIDDHVFTQLHESAFRASIGSHIRHCVDFYTAFVGGVETGRIDYERRERDPQLASKRAVARGRLQAIVQLLHALPDGMTTLLVRSSSAEAEDPDAWCSSSVGRELEFLLSHTLHHYALIATMLRLVGIEPEPTFGVAPATLSYWSKAA